MAYFRPRTYEFKDVMASITLAGKKGKFVSINYLNCPGVTDTQKEFNALKQFLSDYPVNMIQWRNMNFDPALYVRLMTDAGGKSPSLGMANIIKELRSEFPRLVHGYFNPPRESFPSRS